MTRPPTWEQRTDDRLAELERARDPLLVVQVVLLAVTLAMLIVIAAAVWS